MRLGEIYHRCKEFDDSNPPDIDVIRPSSLNGYADEIFKNVISRSRELREIKSLNYIFKKMDKIDPDIFDIPEQKVNVVKNLVSDVRCILNLLQSVGIGENKLGLDIKMPQTDNITDFAKYINELEFVFTKCPFFQDDKESLKLDSVDVGSIWLTIGIAGASIAGGSVLLNNIAAFIDKCYVIKSHKLTCEQQKTEIEKARVDQEQKEEMLKTVERIYQISVENAIKELEETTKIEMKDPEERERVIQSFDRLENLLDKGLEIYEAIDSPKEVKAVFEPVEMHYLSPKNPATKIEDKLSDEQ